MWQVDGEHFLLYLTRFKGPTDVLLSWSLPAKACQ